MTQDWTLAELDSWLAEQNVRITHMSQNDFKVWGVTLQEWHKGKRPRLLYGAGMGPTISDACAKALADLQTRIHARDNPESQPAFLNLDLGALEL